MDISALSNVTTAATSLSNLILVSPQKTIGYQPQKYASYIKDTSKQDEAFLFHYEGEQRVSLSADITDHVIEDNSEINDHIGLHQEVIATHGFIGELTDIAPKGLARLKTVADKLTTVGSYVPQLSVAALVAYNEAAFLYSVGVGAANSAISAWDSISGKSGGENVANGANSTGTSLKNQTAQQQAFQKLYGYFRARKLFTVQTPWAIFQDCAIMSITATQDSESDSISGFEMTFKVLRFANTQIIGGVSSLNTQGRLFSQSSTEQDGGTHSLSPSEQLYTPVK